MVEERPDIIAFWALHIYWGRCIWMRCRVWICDRICCSLKDIIGLIVSEKDDREVTVEFRSWRSTLYLFENRDDFLASMADLMGVGKGSDFSIRLEPYFPHILPDKSPAFYQVSTLTTYDLAIEVLCLYLDIYVVSAWISLCKIFWIFIVSPENWELFSDYFYIQNECEAYFLNRFIGTFNSIRDPAALHLALKEYACNVYVSSLLWSLHYVFVRYWAFQVLHFDLHTACH